MEYILKKIDNNIGRLTINRPDALNAMNKELIEELTKSIEEMIDNSLVGVIIITGSGDKSFIAGADIKKMQQMSSPDALQFGKIGQNLTVIIENSPKPVIAAVNGFALGGGCEISLACHIRVASENANFGQPEVLLGILPGWGGTQRLPRIVGYGIANEIITTGKMISASDAYRIGLVNHLVPLSELIPKCEEIAQEILKNGPHAIAQSLLCIQKSIGKDIQSGLEFEVNRFSELFDTDETKEGLSAFVDKRKPNFR
jgi:enoyl-CoA hydratase